MRIDPWRGPILAVALLLASATAAVAQAPKPTRPDTSDRLQPREVAFTAKVEPERARPGDTVSFEITAKVKEPWHIYAYADEQPQGVAAVPTRVELFQLGGLEPTGKTWTPSEKPTEPPPLGGVIVFDYHEESVTWKRELRVPENAKPGPIDLQGQVMFQLCTNSTCKPPTRRTIDAVELTIVDPSPEQAQLDRPSARISSDALTALGTSLLVPTQETEAPPKPERRDSPAVLQPKEATFTTAIEPAEAKPGDTVKYKVTVKLAPTWHIYDYAESLPEGVTAIPTNFDTFGLAGLEKAGEWTSDRPAHEPEEVSGVLAYKYFEDEVTWTLPLKVPADARPGEHSVLTQITFQICDPKSCKPFSRVTLPAAMVTLLQGDASAPVVANVAATPDPEAPTAAPSDSVSSSTTEPDSSVSEVSEPETGTETDVAAASSSDAPGVGSGELQEKINQGLLPFMAWSALGGLIALLMPCVWPMIPITVNFFVKQGQQGKKSTTGLAITYSLAIIGVFTLVGVVFSAAFGATALNQLSNSPWLNFMVAGLFLAFGFSLLGLFENPVAQLPAERFGAGRVSGRGHRRHLHGVDADDHLLHLHLPGGRGLARAGGWRKLPVPGDRPGDLRHGPGLAILRAGPGAGHPVEPAPQW